MTLIMNIESVKSLGKRDRDILEKIASVSYFSDYEKHHLGSCLLWGQ